MVMNFCLSASITTLTCGTKSCPPCEADTIDDDGWNLKNESYSQSRRTHTRDVMYVSLFDYSIEEGINEDRLRE